MMFAFKKKIHFTQANEFIYKEFEELFLPLYKLLKEESANIKLSSKAVNIILYEIFFFLVYVIHTSGKYKKDEYLAYLFMRCLPFFVSPLKLEVSEYSNRYSKINEFMGFVMKNAQNSGGVGSAIVGFVLQELPVSILDEISVTRDSELEGIFEVEVGKGKNEDVIVYLSMILGLIVGEVYIRFAKDIDSYFKKHKIS